MQRLESVKGNVLFIVHVLNLKQLKTKAHFFGIVKHQVHIRALEGGNLPIKKAERQKQNKFPSIWNLLRRNSQHLCYKIHSLLCMWLQPSIETQVDSLLINNIAEN